MYKYRIQWDYVKSQTYRGIFFGAMNGGHVIEAETPKQAVEKMNAMLRPGERFNPFYLKVTEIGPADAFVMPYDPLQGAVKGKRAPTITSASVPACGQWRMRWSETVTSDRGHYETVQERIEQCEVERAAQSVGTHALR